MTVVPGLSSHAPTAAPFRLPSSSLLFSFPLLPLLSFLARCAIAGAIFERRRLDFGVGKVARAGGTRWPVLVGVGGGERRVERRRGILRLMYIGSCRVIGRLHGLTTLWWRRRRRGWLRILPLASAARCRSGGGVAATTTSLSWCGSWKRQRGGERRRHPTKSPPPRATRRFREAAASTCCGVSSAPAGCEARLCAHDRKRSKSAQRSSEDI